MHYYKGTAAPSSQFVTGAPLIKKGASDLIRVRDGSLALVRRLRPDGTMHVTRLGKLYYRNAKTEYVV